MLSMCISDGSSSDKESNCKRPTRSQSLQHSKDDKESSPAGPEGVKDKRTKLTLLRAIDKWWGEVKEA